MNGKHTFQYAYNEKKSTWLNCGPRQWNCFRGFDVLLYHFKRWSIFLDCFIFLSESVSISRVSCVILNSKNKFHKSEAIGESFGASISMMISHSFHDNSGIPLCNTIQCWDACYHPHNYSFNSITFHGIPEEYWFGIVEAHCCF